MATPNIDSFNKYQGNGSTTQFSVSFPYLNKNFVKVYVKRVGDIEKQIASTDYSWVNDTTILFPASGSSETVLAVGDRMTIQRETPTENDYVFSNQKRLFPEDVMNADDLDMQLLQEQKRQLDRAVVVSPTSDVEPTELLKKVEGIYDSIDNIDAVAENLSDVTTVASNISNVNTVAGNISNVNSVASISSDVTAVKNIASDVSAVAAIDDDVSAVAGIKNDISSVATISQDVSAVASNETNINTAASNISDISAVAANISNVNAVADNETNINAVNSNKTNIDKVATDISNVNTVAGSISNVNSVAGNATNINAVASNSSDITTAATNISAIIAAPTAAENASNSATTAQSWAIGDISTRPEGSAKYWAERAHVYTEGVLKTDKISNCITKIPQDINLELSSGTLTLKSGSKVYIPNGSGVYNVVTTSADYSFTFTTDGQYLLVLINNNQLLRCIYPAKSGSSAPEAPSTGTLWYDTTNNLCKRWSGAVWAQVSFPFAIFTVSSGAISSIDQVFNGFGYIGSTVFALPGVEGLIPNGRNTDGSLKNISFTTTEVLTSTSTYSYNGYLAINSTNFDASSYKNYNEKDNYYYSDSGSIVNRCLCGTFVKGTNGVFTSFKPKPAFHAIDYYDAAKLNENNNWSGTNTFNGTVSLPSSAYGVTQSASDNDRSIATTEFTHNVLKTKATNCLTMVPQDVKVKIENNFPVVEAGSVAYMPDGFETDGTTPKFTAITLSTDLNNTTTGGGEPVSLCYSESGSLFSGYLTGRSVTSFPVSPTNYALYYNSATNELKFYNGSSWIKVALPFATYIRNASGTACEIKETYGYLGYIYDYVFARKGIKGLIPNGRNTDGTLNNTEFETTSTLIKKITNNGYVCLSSSDIKVSSNTYDEEKNTNSCGAYCIAGNLYYSNNIMSINTIDLLTSKQTFNSIDRNDIDNIERKFLINNADNYYYNLTSKRPQIKLLSNGTLSFSNIEYIVPFPNGYYKRRFRDYTTATSPSLEANYDAFIYITGNNQLAYLSCYRCYYGSTQPASVPTYALWFNGSAIKSTSNAGSTWTSGNSVPLAVVSVGSDGKIKYIKQIFNRLAYFANVIFFKTGDTYFNGVSKTAISYASYADGDYLIDIFQYKANHYIEQEEEPPINNVIWYQPSTDKCVYKNSSGTISDVDCRPILGKVSVKSGRVTSLYDKDHFVIADKNNTLFSFLATGKDYIGECQFGAIVEEGTNYIKFSSGKMIQFGTTDSINAGSVLQVSLPKPFASTDYFVTGLTQSGHSGSISSYSASHGVAGNYSTTQFDVKNCGSYSAAYDWIAIGHWK